MAYLKYKCCYIGLTLVLCAVYRRFCRMKYPRALITKKTFACAFLFYFDLYFIQSRAGWRVTQKS